MSPSRVVTGDWCGVAWRALKICYRGTDRQSVATKVSSSAAYRKVDRVRCVRSCHADSLTFRVAVAEANRGRIVHCNYSGCFGPRVRVGD